jgi:WD40 repeat protein
MSFRCAVACAASLLGPLQVSSDDTGAAPAALHLNSPPALAFSNDEKWVALANSGGRLSVRRLHDGGIAWAGYHCHLSALAFSKDDSLVASGGGNRAGETTLKVWAADTGALVMMVTNSTAHPRQVVFSPDNCLLLAAFEGGAVACWDVASGQLRWQRTDLVASGFLNFTPRGRMVQVTSSGQPTTVLDIHDGSIIHELTPGG